MARPRRQIAAAAEEANAPPDALGRNQSLVRVVRPQGNNLYACELPDRKVVILELAQRFRNTIWIKRGGFVVAERYEGETESSRAVGEIVNVVRDEKAWRKQPYWPGEFARRALDDEAEEYGDSLIGKMPPSDSEGE